MHKHCSARSGGVAATAWEYASARWAWGAAAAKTAAALGEKKSQDRSIPGKTKFVGHIRTCKTNR